MDSTSLEKKKEEKIRLLRLHRLELDGAYQDISSMGRKKSCFLYSARRSHHRFNVLGLNLIMNQTKLLQLYALHAFLFPPLIEA